MSEQPDSPADTGPTFDTADRLRKALREQNISVSEMADYLGVSRTSVSNWINGRVRPDTRTARLWALRTGVPAAWLCDGTGPRCLLGPLRAGTDAGHALGKINMQRYLSRIDLERVA